MGKVINGKTEEQINIEKQEENAASIASLANQIVEIGEANAEAEMVLARDGNSLLGSRLNLKEDSIRGTKQSITFNSDGTVQKVQHIDTDENVVREDVFTYSGDTITEVRTLADTSTITYVYHLDTLETEVS